MGREREREKEGGKTEREGGREKGGWRERRGRKIRESKKLDGGKGGRERAGKEGAGGGKTDEEGRRERTRDVSLPSIPTLSWLCWYIV